MDNLRVGYIDVRLTITSVFICKQFPEPVVLKPYDNKRVAVSVVNTELLPIRAWPKDFTLAVGNASLPDETAMRQSPTLHIPMQPRRERKGSHSTLTPWLSFAPSSFSLKRGSSLDFVVTVKYPSRSLPLSSDKTDLDEIVLLAPRSLWVHFSFDVVLQTNSRVSGDVEDTIGQTVELQFVPGNANRSLSFVRVPSVNGSVERKMDVAVALKDDFNYCGASARYSSSGSSTQSTKSEIPVLSVRLETLEARTSRAPISYTIGSRLTDGMVLTSLVLHMEFIAVGRSVLDVRLDGESISNCPMNLTTLAANCEGDHEVQDNFGTTCLCEAGYYEDSEGQCTPCGEGTRKSSVSDEKTCETCPSGYFSLKAATQCYKCPAEGLQCSRGNLEMLSGYWCEECQERDSSQSNKEELARKIISGESIAFYRCVVPDACIVNGSTFITRCKEGYRDELCGHCERNHVKMLDGHCARCGDGNGNRITTGISAGVFFALLVGLTVYSTKKSAWEKDSKQHTKKAQLNKIDGGKKALDIYRLNVSDARERAQLIHDYYSRNGHWESLKRLVLLVVDYFQICSILHGMDISPFAGTLEWLNGVAQASAMNPSKASPLRCSTNTSVFEVAVSVMLSPFVVIGLLLLLHAIVECIRSRWAFRVNRWATDSIFSLVVVLNLIHMAVTDVTLRSLDTYPDEIQSTVRARIDIGIETTNSKFATLQAVGLISLFLFVFGVPILVGGFLRWWHSKAKSPKIYKELLKFVGGFRLSSYGYLWEPLVLLRKLLLLIVAVFSHEPVTQMILGTGVLLFSYICLAFFRPYYDTSLNHLEGFMIMVSVFNFYFGLLSAPFRDAGRGFVSPSFNALRILTGILQLIFLVAVAVVIVVLIPGAVSKISLAVFRKIAPIQRKYRMLVATFKTSCGRKERDQSDNRRVHWTGMETNLGFKSSANPLFSRRLSQDRDVSLPPIKSVPDSTSRDASSSPGKRSPTSRHSGRRQRPSRRTTKVPRSMQRREIISPTGLVVRYNRPATRFQQSSPRQEISGATGAASNSANATHGNLSRTNINPLHFSSTTGS
eukprot:gb/GECG01014504.1/.p1 GENE.gb/GECG01014504.1/~~gb/GECG01014504.1/.p1  ORF type:complete len:1064 (+),score=83.41 gb/GECG01014504.1/:1-3192(+)